MKKQEIIDFFIDNNFKKVEEFTAFIQLDRVMNSNNVMSIVITEYLYIMLHSKITKDYIFSNHYKLEEVNQVLLYKIMDFYLCYNKLF